MFGSVGRRVKTGHFCLRRRVRRGAYSVVRWLACEVPHAMPLRLRGHHGRRTGYFVRFSRFSAYVLALLAKISRPRRLSTFTRPPWLGFRRTDTHHLWCGSKPRPEIYRRRRPLSVPSSGCVAVLEPSTAEVMLPGLGNDAVKEPVCPRVQWDVFDNLIME